MIKRLTVYVNPLAFSVSLCVCLKLCYLDCVFLMTISRFVTENKILYETMILKHIIILYLTKIMIQLHSFLRLPLFIKPGFRKLFPITTKNSASGMQIFLNFN